MTITCEWCNKRNAQFELAIYKLKEIETYKKNKMVEGKVYDKYKNIGRGDLYVRVKICDKCLPVTKVEESITTNTVTSKIRKHIKMEHEK